jgi:hypothetical protein
VEFEPEARVGYQHFFRLQDELSALFEREVDLFTPNSLKLFAREQAMQSKLGRLTRLETPPQCRLLTDSGLSYSHP